MKKFIILLLLTALFSACDDSGSGSGGGGGNPSSKDGRILGLDIKDVPGLSWADAYLKAYNELHINSVKFSLDWNTTETTIGDYTALDSILGSIGAVFHTIYPAHNVEVVLVLRPVDTASINIPGGASYDSNPFDNSTETNAALADFNNYISHIYTYLNSNFPLALAKIKIIQVGNEYGGQIDTATERTNWLVFLQGVTSHIHTTFGSNLKVGSIATFNGLVTDHKTFFESVNAITDIVSVNYYAITNTFYAKSPMDKSTISADFASIINIYPNRQIAIQECGVPSSTDCNSSESIQSDFLDAVFATWDDYKNNILMIDFAWSTDVSSSQVSSWVASYGMSGHPNETQFAGYLGSLGYINYDGTEKASWGHFESIINSRGW